MKYDVEADWFLLNTCNFRCSYCFDPADLLSSKINIYGSPKQWKEGFDATGKTWLLHITGGEPSLYSGFVELCHQLTQNHYLSINSNLTHHCVKDFAQRINPERIHFINASIHFEERIKRGLLNGFIQRLQELRNAKFNILLSSVMTPYVVSNFSEIITLFEAHGLFPIPKVLRGIYEGRHYPESYSVEQKQIISDYLTTARHKYETVLNNMGELPSIDMFSDSRFFDGIRDYHGRLCGAGYRFVALTPNGTVCRCGGDEVFGNILFKDVKLLNAPKFCDTEFCPYFCEKYSVKNTMMMDNQFKFMFNKYAHFRGKMLMNYYLWTSGGSLKFIREIHSGLRK
jgi:MoaA/NifB/PqqE/SkfB family radical SAM enzyme